MRVKFKSDTEVVRHLTDQFMRRAKANSHKDGRQLHPGLRALLAEVGLTADEVKNTTSKVESMIVKIALLVVLVTELISFMAPHVSAPLNVYAEGQTKPTLLTQVAHFDCLLVGWIDVIPDFVYPPNSSEKPVNGEKRRESQTTSAPANTNWKPSSRSNPYSLMARDNHVRTVRPGEGAGQLLPMLIDPFGRSVEARYSDGRWHGRNLD